MQNPHGPPCADDALQMLSSKMGSKRQHLCPCLQRGHPRWRRPQPCQAHTWDGDAEMPLSHPSLGKIRRGAQGTGTAGKEESETHAAALPSGRDKNQQRCKKRKTTTTKKTLSLISSYFGEEVAPDGSNLELILRQKDRCCARPGRKGCVSQSGAGSSGYLLFNKRLWPWD